MLNNLVGWAYTTGEIRLQSDGTSGARLCTSATLPGGGGAARGAPRARARRAFNIGPAEQNYRISELAEIVHDRLPECDVTFAEGAPTDPRSYRVDFSKFASTFPHCRFEWSAERGADELARAYETVGLTVEDFQGDRYVRVGTIRRLLDAGVLDDDLRWIGLLESAPPR